MCYIVVNSAYRELGFFRELPDHAGEAIQIGWNSDRMHHISLQQRWMHQIGNRFRKGPLPAGKNGTQFVVYMATGDTDELDTCANFRPSYPVNLRSTVEAIDFDCGLFLLAIEDSSIFSEKTPLNT